MQKIMILGGTKFIGRNIVDALSKLEDYDLYINAVNKSLNDDKYSEIIFWLFTVKIFFVDF